jgi:hypothetical protein
MCIKTIEKKLYIYYFCGGVFVVVEELILILFSSWCYCTIEFSRSTLELFDISDTIPSSTKLSLLMANNHLLLNSSFVGNLYGLKGNLFINFNISV